MKTETTQQEKAGQRRREYVEKLNQHPKVKALRREKSPGSKKRGSTRKLKQGVPELIALAMQDKEMAECIDEIRKMNRYERKIDELTRKRLNKEAVPVEDEITLVREGNTVERGYRKVISVLARKIYQDPATEAYVEAAAENPMPDEMRGDLFLHLDPGEQEAMEYLGLGADHPVWQEMAGSGRKQTRKPPSPGEVVEAFKNLEKSAQRIRYSRAPRNLVKEDILTLGGDQLTDHELIAWIALLYFLGPLVIPYDVRIKIGTLINIQFNWP